MAESATTTTWPGNGGAVWHAFKTKPGAEAQARDHLVRQGFEIFVPKVKITLRRGSRLIDKPAWLFPGYGFIRLGTNPAFIRAINGTRGVSYLISLGSKPAPLPNGFVEALRSRCHDDVLSGLPDGPKIGDQVEFLSGPFVQQVGKLVTMNSNGRVKVLMALLSGSIHIETKADNLFTV